MTHARRAMLIRNKRAADGIGLRAAAVQSGLSASTLSRLERGVKVSLDGSTMVKLARWLDTSVADLLGGDTQSAPLAQLSTLDTVEVALRADDRLTVEGREVLVGLVRQVYGVLTR